MRKTSSNTSYVMQEDFSPLFLSLPKRVTSFLTLKKKAQKCSLSLCLPSAIPCTFLHYDYSQEIYFSGIPLTLPFELCNSLIFLNKFLLKQSSFFLF